MSDDQVSGERRYLQERAVIVGAGEGDHVSGNDEQLLDELAELVSAAGAEVVGRAYQRRTARDAAFYIGSGKVDEVASKVRDANAELVVFDNELSPRQVRNLEEKLKVRVLDRSEIILDIFALHAKTQEARLQVELAQLRYTRPRLRRMWTHLEKIRGGVGMRGPGEKQIETDRRLIDRRIMTLEREIETVNARRKRLVDARGDEFTVSLVGYTNAGKSTLMNRLTGAGVYEADQLFATLDTKTSSFDLKSGQRVLLSDTVGFIRDLPHYLVASFHATLEEVRQAKLLLHVVDASRPGVEQQVETVHAVLEKELGLTDRREILVFNKIDAIRDMLEFNVLVNRYPQHIRVSAVTGEGIDELIHQIELFDSRSLRPLDICIPARDGKLQAEINRIGHIDACKFVGDYIHMTVRIPVERVDFFRAYTCGGKHE